MMDNLDWADFDDVSAPDELVGPDVIPDDAMPDDIVLDDEAGVGLDLPDADIMGLASPEPGIPVPPDPGMEMPDLPNFDPSHAGPGIIGDPGGEMANWHQQTYDDTCAVVSQEFILESLTGQDFSEDELRQEAIDNGWYTPGGGTPVEHVGGLLEAHGVDVERTEGATLQDIADKLSQGEKVIVGLDADEIWMPGQDFVQDEILGDVGSIPGQGANHAVEVIGIDNSDPNHPMVILNDPGHPDGQGVMVPADEFVDAWNDSGNYMVYTV